MDKLGVVQLWKEGKRMPMCSADAVFGVCARSDQKHTLANPSVRTLFPCHSEFRAWARGCRRHCCVVGLMQLLNDAF